MTTKTFLMVYDYDEQAGETLSDVFNMDLKVLDKKIIKTMNVGKRSSFSNTLTEMMNSKKITGSELMFLATVGLKSLIEEIEKAAMPISLFAMGIKDLRRKISMLPDDIREQLLEQLPEEIRQKLKGEENDDFDDLWDAERDLDDET